MDERMSLQHAIDHVQVVVTSSHLHGWKENREAWEVVRAHLTQPSQAVDVDSLYAVIRGIGYTTHSQARELAEAVLQHATRAIGNAQSSPTPTQATPNAHE